MNIKWLVAPLLALSLASCAIYSIETSKVPAEPLNLTRLGVYFDPEWNPTVSGDTRFVAGPINTVKRFAIAMNRSVATGLPPILAEHGVTAVLEPEPDLPVLYMAVGDVQRTCQANWGDCNTRVQIVGTLARGSQESLWAFESWMTPGSMDAQKFDTFLHDVVGQMARDRAIPGKH